jgi:hypothetical protein
LAGEEGKGAVEGGNEDSGREVATEDAVALVSKAEGCALSREGVNLRRRYFSFAAVNQNRT